VKKEKDIDLSRLRTGIIAGSLCPKPLMERIIEEMNLKGMTNCYG
jgi:fatty-acyl-CoA synthase